MKLGGSFQQPSKRGKKKKKTSAGLLIATANQGAITPLDLRLNAPTGNKHAKEHELHFQLWSLQKQTSIEAEISAGASSRDCVQFTFEGNVYFRGSGSEQRAGEGACGRRPDRLWL